MQALFMQKTIILGAVTGLVLCILAAGCTSPATVTPVQTSLPPRPTVQSSSVATVVSTPLAVETLPSEQYVDLVLSKQRPDSTIHLLYNGGKGEVFVQNIMMQVTRSDGQVSQQYMNDGTRKPQRGDELVMDGTRGSDQVVVYLTSAGKTYKVIDQPLVLEYL